MGGKLVLYGALLISATLFSQEDMRELGNLPTMVSETSGLLFHNGKLITHNDSGNTPQLFEIDTTSLEITRTVTISNVENVDWEDLAQDDDFIYIGDFGNNSGIRTDLSIYKISKQDYDQSEIIAAERLDFSYEDQTDFMNNGNSDWDAEAFFSLNDELIILTKQWQTEGTVAYSIPKTPGNHSAKNLERYDISGLVTGATYNPLSEVLFLIGYSSLLGPFTVRVDSPTIASIFNASTERIEFGNGLAQVEGITYVDLNSYFVTSESFSNTSPSINLESKLFAFDTPDMEGEPPVEEPPVEEPPVEDPMNQETRENGLLLYREFGSNFLHYELTTDRDVFGRAIHDPLGRLLDYAPNPEPDTSTIDLSTFGSSVYYLTFYLDNGVLSKAFAK